MARWAFGFTLLTLMGCSQSKRPSATASPVASDMTSAVAVPSREAAKPSLDGGMSSGRAVRPSDGSARSRDAIEAAAASGDAARSSSRAVEPSRAHAKPVRPVVHPAPTGMMPHGSFEDGTLEYNPPAPPPPRKRK
jgi:hypothetical protein